MAGEAAARGVTQVLGTDAVRNLPAALNDVGDDLAKLIPYVGTATATTDGNGYATITHGLGFTPAQVWAQSSKSTPGTDPILVLAVDNITSTQFRVRLASFTVQTGANYYANLGGLSGLTFAIRWMAFR